MRATSETVLVVEDDPRYARLIQVNLRASGYKVERAATGPEAVEAVAGSQPDLVLLDIMLPGMDGYTVCERIRQFSDVPIVMLTAMSETEDVVKGLDAGADDYIKKPFSAQELLARVRAVLRRPRGLENSSEPGIVSIGDLWIDFSSRRVRRSGEEVQLTPTEYALLRELVRHAGRVLVPAYLLETIWGSDDTAQTRILWQAVHRLRQKIEPDPRKPVYILTCPGVGYIFEASHSDQQRKESVP